MLWGLEIMVWVQQTGKRNINEQMDKTQFFFRAKSKT